MFDRQCCITTLLERPVLLLGLTLFMLMGYVESSGAVPLHPASEVKSKVMSMSANPGEKSISEDDLLRREELRLKIRDLSLSWWKRPAYMASVATIAAAILGLVWGIATGFFDVARRELEVTKRELQAENRELGQKRDEQSRLFQDERKQWQETIAELNERRDKLDKEINRIRDERDKLETEHEALRKKYHGLDLQATGLLVALDRMGKGSERGLGKYFSILNSKDPINKLESYGWSLGSYDNLLIEYYYLRISHPKMAAGEELSVTRTFELDTLKRNKPDDWRKHVESFQPLLVLDFSYFQLLKDEQAEVGGVIYTKDGRVIEFYAPLSDWSRKLGPLLEAR